MRMADLPGRVYVSGQLADTAAVHEANQAQSREYQDLRRQKMDQVLDALMDGAQSASEVADVIDLAPQTVGFYLRLLLERGEIEVLNPDVIPSRREPRRYGVPE